MPIGGAAERAAGYDIFKDIEVMIIGSPYDDRLIGVSGDELILGGGGRGLHKRQRWRGRAHGPAGSGPPEGLGFNYP